MRAGLAMSAATLPGGLQSFIPCHQGTVLPNLSTCLPVCAALWGGGMRDLSHHAMRTAQLAPTSLPEPKRRNLSIVSSHINWGIWNNAFLSAHHPDATRASAAGPAVQASCFVMFREPVSRFISLYYERVFHPARNHALAGVPLNDLSADVLQTLLSSCVVPCPVNCPTPGALAHHLRLMTTRRFVVQYHGLAAGEGFSDSMCAALCGTRVNDGDAPPRYALLHHTHPPTHPPIHTHTPTPHDVARVTTCRVVASRLLAIMFVATSGHVFPIARLPQQSPTCSSVSWD